jgi:hypothetical protein
MYPSALALCGAVMVLAFRIADRLESGRPSVGALILAGTLAGLAAWTHLMSLSIVAAVGAHLFRRARAHRAILLYALVPFLLASAPWWTSALADRQATRGGVSDRREGFVSHLLAVLPASAPAGGVVGMHAVDRGRPRSRRHPAAARGR